MRSIVLLCAVLLTTAKLAGQSWSSHSSNQAFLGVVTDELDRNKEKLLQLPDYGTMVTAVVPGSAAEMAGLQAFDYIIGIGDKDISWNNDLTDLLAELRPGDQVDVRLIRQGQTMSLPVKLTDTSYRGKKRHSNAFLGISEHDKSNDSAIGVMITTVCNSSAEELGLQNGDIIMALNGQPMIDWHDITIALNQLNAGDPITIDYTRNGQPYRAMGKVGSEEREDCSSTRGYLGVYPGHMDREKARTLNLPTLYGSYLKKVIPGSGADEAGLQPLDYIIRVEDYELNEHQSLSYALRRYTPGEVVTVKYIRQGETRTAEVTLSGPLDGGLFRPCSQEPFFGVSTNHNPNRRQGVAVNIVKGSAAEAAGLKTGDIITGLAGKRILDWSDLSAVINGQKPGQQMEVNFIRDGREMTVSATMGAECDPDGQSRNENNWYDNNFDSSFDNDRDNDMIVDEPAVDMERIRVSMEDMNEDEAAEMARRGVEMPIINNLRIEAINIFPNPNRGMFRLEFELPQTGET
ncbi:MAG: PDZ domain-containing protein, partial [Bacteroidetes bacterium]